MTSVVNPKFVVKPVAAALALAVSAGMAVAAPTPNQMPGAGKTVQVSLGSTNVVGTTYTSLVSGANLAIDGKVVIQWGGSGAPVDPLNPAGFNLGANAIMGFYGTGANPAVLNIDASGNASQLYGALISNIGPGTSAPAMAIANANGIVLAAGGRIVAPTGLFLLGVDMNNALSKNEFVGNNGWAVPNPPTYGASHVTYGAVSPNGNISIGGAINGDFVLNTPAQYVFIGGNNVDVLNTGNVFGNFVVVEAGVYASASKASVNGVTNTTVNRMWNVDAGILGLESCCYINTGLPTSLQIDAAATGNVTNVGSVSMVAGGIGGPLIIGAKGNVRTGTLGDPNPTVGIFSDTGITIDSYSDTSKVEIYGNVTGYTTNKTLPTLYVNYFSRYSPVAINPDVTINAVKPGGQPSTVTTTGAVQIFGGNIAVNSTINHKANSAGGVQSDALLIVNASKTLSVTADIGAGNNVQLTSKGTMTVSGNVISDTNAGGAGGIYIVNNGAGAATTISGNLTTPASTSNDIRVTTNGPTTISGKMTSLGGGDIYAYNYGVGAGNFTTVSGNVSSTGNVYIYNFQSPINNPLTVSGNVTATGGVYIGNYGASLGNVTTVSGNVTSTGGNVNVFSYGLITGNLTVTGTLNANNDVNIFSDGNAQVRNVVAGNNINTTVLGTALLVDGPWTAGNTASITSTLATTSLKPAATIMAPNVMFNGLNFRSVNATGSGFATPGQKPASQIVTNNFTVIVKGSINGPVVGTTNWVVNSMDIAPLNTLAPVFVSVTANGGGFQAVNLKVLGDEIFNTGATTTPFIGVLTTTGGFPAGGLQGNLGSQLINQATGYIKILGTPTGALFGPPVAAQWPGGAAFIAGTTLELLTPFYNAWSTASPPFGGSFFTAPYIALSGYIATSGTAWANFSTKPVTGDPTVYQIRALSPTSFGFVPTTDFVKNNYVSTVAGGPICTTTGPTTWVVCP